MKIDLIKFIFKLITNHWYKHFVVYPLNAFEDIQIMMYEMLLCLICYRSRYYFILFEVDAPVMQRFGRYNTKYANSQIDLVAFIEMDDKVIQID